MPTTSFITNPYSCQRQVDEVFIPDPDVRHVVKKIKSGPSFKQWQNSIKEDGIQIHEELTESTPEQSFQTITMTMDSDGDFIGVDVPPLTKSDTLIVIDMQKDFLPRNHTTNPRCGSFGVPETEDIVQRIALLIQTASQNEATVIVSRDYHPRDHCSFNTQGGPFNPHCIQGTEGSEFISEVGKAIEFAEISHPENTFIVFKAMHEKQDSFGAVPYKSSFTNIRANQDPDNFDSHIPVCTKKFPVSVKNVFGDHPNMSEGCSSAPWTGSLALKTSGLVVRTLAAVDGQTEPQCTYNVNAPPDVLSMADDDCNRDIINMQDIIKKKKAFNQKNDSPAGRIFVCGVAMDYCGKTCAV
jgi:nicotinamidase-related amidase